jgi:hypothetical protein
VEEATRQVRLKVETRLFSKEPDPVPPDVTILDLQREYVRFWLTEPRAGMAAQDVERLRTVAHRVPAPGALLRYAYAAARNGQAGQAERALRVMCHTALVRHCDSARAVWLARAAEEPAVAVVRFPPTPAVP